MTARRPLLRALAPAVLGLGLLAACEPRPDQPTAPEPGPAPEAATATEAGAPCRDALGEAEAARLAERCRAVSPATRPPCNVANPCAMIQAEIDRACALWDADGDAPEECAA